MSGRLSYTLCALVVKCGFLCDKNRQTRLIFFNDGDFSITVSFKFLSPFSCCNPSCYWSKIWTACCVVDDPSLSSMLEMMGIFISRPWKHPKTVTCGWSFLSWWVLLAIRLILAFAKIKIRQPELCKSFCWRVCIKSKKPSAALNQFPWYRNHFRRTRSKKGGSNFQGKYSHYEVPKWCFLHKHHHLRL